MSFRLLECLLGVLREKDHAREDRVNLSLRRFCAGLIRQSAQRAFGDVLQRRRRRMMVGGVGHADEDHEEPPEDDQQAQEARLQRLYAKDPCARILERALQWFLEPGKDRDPVDNARALLCYRVLVPVLRATPNFFCVQGFFRRHGARLAQLVLVSCSPSPSVSNLLTVFADQSGGLIV